MAGLNDTANDILRESIGYTISYAVLCSLISVSTVIGNILLFYTILKTPLLRTATNSLLLSLATADLVAGFIMIPLYILQFVERTSDDDVKSGLCMARKFLFLLTSGASITSLAVVSVDRMFAVSYVFAYARKMNAKIVTIIIVTVWSVCLTLTSIAVFVPIDSWKKILERCGPGIPRASYLIVTPTSFYLPGIAILVSYIKIFTIARRHRRKITVQHECSMVQPRVSAAVESANNDLTSTRERTSTLNSTRSRPNRFTKIRSSLTNDLKAAKTVSILVGLFLICWSPVAFFYIYLNTTGEDPASSLKYTYIHDAFMLLSFLNAAIDPILYILLNKEIRSTAKRHLKELFRRS